MTIQQIVEEARKLGITYGEYVKQMKENPRLIKPERARVKKETNASWLKSCEICGKSFFANNGKQKYCSANCILTARRQRRADRLKNQGEEHICAYCGKSFRGKKEQKYCSKACGAEGMRKKWT